MEQDIKKARWKRAVELTRYVEDESGELGIGYLTLIHGCYGSGGDRNAVMKSLSFGLTHPPIFEIIRDVYEYHVRHGWPQSESDPAPEWCFRAHKQSHSKAERTEQTTENPSPKPKEGEWWMCEQHDGNLAVYTVSYGFWASQTGNIVVCQDLTPLYRMIPDPDGQPTKT